MILIKSFVTNLRNQPNSVSFIEMIVTFWNNKES